MIGRQRQERRTRVRALLGVVAFAVALFIAVGSGPAGASPAEHYSGTHFGANNFQAWLLSRGTTVTRIQQTTMETLDAAALAPYDMVILDEILGSIKANLVTLDDVLALVRAKPARLHLVLTGRGAPPEIVDAADRIVWVAGHGIDEAFAVTDAAQGVLLLQLRRF